VVASEPDIANAAKGGDIVPLFIVGEQRSPLYPNCDHTGARGQHPKELTDAYKTITATAVPWLCPRAFRYKVDYLRKVFKKMSDTRRSRRMLPLAGVWRPSYLGEDAGRDQYHQGE